MLRRERARTMAMEKPAKDIEIENPERKLGCSGPWKRVNNNTMEI